jgi:hypothetical protein
MTFLVRTANAGRKSRWGATILLFTALCTSAIAQESHQVQPASFLHANDKFALNLLMVAHEEEQGRNIVLAPLPVSLTFAALMDGTTDTKSVEELAIAFHWEEPRGIDVAGRMLLTRFAKPKPRPIPHIASPSPAAEVLRNYSPGQSEELWLSAAFLYRGEGSLSQDFIDRVNYENCSREKIKPD